MKRTLGFDISHKIMSDINLYDYNRYQSNKLAGFI